MLKTTLKITISHDKPEPDLAGVIENRLWSYRSVTGVSAEVLSHAAVNAIAHLQPHGDALIALEVL